MRTPAAAAIVFAVLVTACSQSGVIPTYSQVAGVYRMTMMAGDSPGLEMGLYLNEDYTAQMTSDYLTGDPLLVETGTWIINGDGTVSVRLTQIDGVAMYPVVFIDFALENGILNSVDWDRVLYGPDGLTFTRI